MLKISIYKQACLAADLGSEEVSLFRVVDIAAGNEAAFSFGKSIQVVFVVIVVHPRCVRFASVDMVSALDVHETPNVRTHPLVQLAKLAAAARVLPRVGISLAESRGGELLSALAAKGLTFDIERWAKEFEGASAIFARWTR